METKYIDSRFLELENYIGRLYGELSAIKTILEEEFGDLNAKFEETREKKKKEDKSEDSNKEGDDENERRIRKRITE